MSQKWIRIKIHCIWIHKTAFLSVQYNQLLTLVLDSPTFWPPGAADGLVLPGGGGGADSHRETDSTINQSISWYNAMHTYPSKEIGPLDERFNLKDQQIETQRR